VSALSGNGRRAWILALDTATSRVVLAAGLVDGTPIGETTWVAGYRHGETLLPAIGRLTGEANLRRSRLAGIVVGTGPGAFTGLRVGLATAKGLAHGLGVPIAGVSTAEALLAAARADVGAGRPLALLVPAGPSDRVLVEDGQTVVIGGVYEFTDRNSISKVPFLGDVPFLGNLFKKRGRNKDKAELLVFVTPKVLRVAKQN